MTEDVGPESMATRFQAKVCLHDFDLVSDRRSITQLRGGGGAEEEGRSILIIKQLSGMNISCREADDLLVLRSVTSLHRRRNRVELFVLFSHKNTRFKQR